MATNVNIETGLIGVTPKYKFHDQVTVNTGDTIQDVSWTDCEYLAKFKKNSLGPMIVRPDYIYEDTAGNLARNGVTIVGVTTENTLARVTDPEVLRILLANISHTLDNQIRLSEVASGSIGAAWFAGNTKIEVFDCPRGYSVAASAFNGCTGLREVFIQRNVSLGNSAFNGCNRVDCYHFLDTNVGTFGTTVFAGLSGSCYLYVPNEAVVNYCKVANLGSYITRIRGHIKGWHLICTDGSYKYNLRDCYDTATNISFRLEGTYVTNLALSVDPETNEATVTVTGMLPDTDEDVELVYGFDYRNHHFSGYVPLHLKTGAAEIIEFEDPEVKRICVANWGGIYRMSLDGYEGEMTKEQAAKVSSIGTGIFSYNKVISKFKEFSLFTGITNMHNDIFRNSTISEIEFPPSLKSITGSYTFMSCTRLKRIELPEGFTNVSAQQWIWGAGVTTLILPSTFTTGGTQYLLATYGANNSLTVICKAVNPSSWSGSVAYPNCIKVIYVPNESVVAYRGASVWSSLKSKIHGFFDMPPIIIKDGTYTMTLRNIFEDYSNLQVSIEENDYLTLSNVEDNVATIVASGITPSTDATATVSYSFVYRGSTISGTIDIPILYKETITFEDAEVKRICVANWGGEYCASTNKYGMKGEITMEQAAAVSSIGTTFRTNTVIRYFHEFRYFTGVTSLNSNQGSDSNAAFSRCSSLKEISLPPQLTTLQAWVFSSCSSIYLVNLNEGLQSIRSNVFYYASNFKRVAIPSTVTSISGNTFRYVNTYVMESTLPPQVESLSERATVAAIYVPDMSVELYKASPVWSTKASIIYPMTRFPKDHPNDPWIEDLQEKGLLPDYIDFEDSEVKRICCTNWGDYTEIAKTETVTEESATVSISTAYTYVHNFYGTTATRTALKTLTSSRTKTESDAVGTTTTTTNYPVGMTKEQAAAVSSLGVLRDSGFSFDAYCNYFPQSMDNYGYVTENMIVHFDGIDKGGDSSSWTDIISGTLKFPYSEHSTIESNCIHMDGQGSLVASSFVPSRYQFEICAKNINSGTGAIYCSGRQDDNCCIVQSDGFYTCPSGWGNIVWKVNPRPDIIVMSHCGNNKPKMLNGVIYPGTSAYKSYDVKNNITTLGGRNDSDYIECMVYSIRIYSRQLTESEMMHNQRVDNERFNMGLTF